MVRATFSGFDTALSALRMNQKKLDVVGHNLANMNTEGYTRQELKTSSINYENPTSFYMNSNDVNVGFGVAMDEVRQLRDQFLDGQYRTQNGKSSYNESIGESLKSLSLFLDETKVNGIRSSFDDIQRSLTNMQDPSKVQDPVYEGELMSRVQAMTTLMNSAAESIHQAEKNEFHKIDGTNTSENGAIQKINSLVSDIGDLNNRIKKNQLLGNPALELQDQRNLKLDELSKYVPIEVEHFSEEYSSPTPPTTRYRIYNYDSAGNVKGRSDWPEDVRVNLVYRDSSAGNGTEVKKITLVNGAIDADLQDASGKHNNVGKVELAAGSIDAPLNTKLKFTGFQKRGAAADTFRAGAIEQLVEWGNRVGVDVIHQKEGSDPAAVVFDALQSFKAKNADVLIIDTAGRLHNKKNLMQELGKINRIIDREFAEGYRETLVVLDATTGQNAMSQAKLFKECSQVTGVILSKMDSTAKGGMALSIQAELGLPVKYMGTGEKVENLQRFDAKRYAEDIFDLH